MFFNVEDKQEKKIINEFVGKLNSFFKTNKN